MFSLNSLSVVLVSSYLVPTICFPLEIGLVRVMFLLSDLIGRADNLERHIELCAMWGFAVNYD